MARCSSPSRPVTVGGIAYGKSDLVGVYHESFLRRAGYMIERDADLRAGGHGPRFTAHLVQSRREWAMKAAESHANMIGAASSRACDPR